MAEVTDETSFWDHLEEFRWSVLRSVIAVVIITVVCFIFMPYIYNDFIMGPTRSDFFIYHYLCKVGAGITLFPDFCNDDFHVKIINIHLTSQFLRHFTTSLWLGLTLAFPYMIFEVWRFIKPALYVQEKRSIRRVLLFGTCMFFIGCAVGYLLVFPMTFRFLATYYLSDTIENQISLDSYMDNFVMLIFMLGVVFELPLLTWLLSRMGLLKRSFFSKYRRHTIVVLLIVAALITPSGDPFTLSVVFFPLYFLFELSRFTVKR